MVELKKISDQIKEQEVKLKKATAEYQEILLGLPNPPYDEVPDGDEADFALVHTWGDKPAFSTPKSGEMLGDGELKNKARAKVVVKPKVARKNSPASAKATRKQQKRKVAKVRIRDGWYLQVAAEQSESLALERKASLSSKNIPTYIQSAMVRGKTFYRVIVGPFASRRNAEAQIQAMRVLGAAKGDPFVRRVKGGR